MSGHMKLSVWSEPAERLDDPDNGDLVPRSEAGADDSRAAYSAPEHAHAWWGQYTAPGYMDRTDTSGPYASAAEAARETFALYGDDEPGSDDRRELAALLWQIRARGAL